MGGFPEIFALGRAVADAVRWQQGERNRITLVAKATYTLGEDTPMELLDPEPFRGFAGTDRGDLVPYRTRADVLVFGDPAEHPAGVDVSLTREASLLETKAEV